MTLEFMTLLPLFILSATLLLVLPIHRHFKNKPPNLRHPPTPLALPILGHLHLLRPLVHHSFHQLSARYGPLFRLRLGSVPCVVVSTPDLAKEFLKTHEFTFSARKHSAAVKRLTYDSGFAFAPIGPYWKFIKKLCTYELLGSRNLNHFLPIRTRELNSFLQLLMKKAMASEAVNVTEELLKLTNNIISQMMLSIRCSGTKGEADEARTLVREVTRVLGEFNVSDFVGFCRNLDLQGIGRKCEDIHRRYDALLEKIITNREEVRKKKKKKKQAGESCREGGQSAEDFLDILLDVLEEGDSEMKLNRDHIKALVLDFFTAATDTSAIAIEWALAELINNPVVLKKANEEIDKVVGKHRLVSESDGPNLPYIQAIIKETLRLHPPIPMIARKSVQDCVVGGYHIPAHTFLFVNVWSIGRNPEYWENPLGFQPERFLKDGPMGLMDVKGQHFHLLPFGTGRRGCPGISLAMKELHTVVAAMIQCFEWMVVGRRGEKMDGDGAVDMTERPGLTAPRARDLVCVPIARTDRLNGLLHL